MQKFQVAGKRCKSFKMQEKNAKVKKKIFNAKAAKSNKKVMENEITDYKSKQRLSIMEMSREMVGK